MRQAALNRPPILCPPNMLQPLERCFGRVPFSILWVRGGAILQVVMLLALGVPARMRNVAEDLTKNQWGQCFVFVFLFLLAITLLMPPLRVYGHHVAVGYGLSVQGWGSWAWDQAKSFLLTWARRGLLVMVLFWVIRRSPKQWWFWFWVPTMAAVLFGVLVSPVVVDPLFNKFEPLSEQRSGAGEQLEKVATRSGVGLPADRMFFMRASHKVTGMNAYVTGFGPSKRFVIWDTTITAATPDELAGIFGHELGHYALHHVVMGVRSVRRCCWLAFFVGQRATEWLLLRFGARCGLVRRTIWPSWPSWRWC